MKPRQIALVVGSLRRESINLQLSHALVKLAPPTLTFVRVQIGDLPLYNQDDDDRPHENVQRLKREIRAADGVVFVTPEYNRSMPGVLKNAIDHASRPYGQSAWEKKPAGVLGASIGANGSAMAQQHLRNTLAYLDMPTLGQPEVFLHVKDGFFGKDHEIADARTKGLVQKWLDAYAAWVERHAG